MLGNKKQHKRLMKRCQVDKEEVASKLATSFDEDFIQKQPFFLDIKRFSFVLTSRVFGFNRADGTVVIGYLY